MHGDRKTNLLIICTLAMTILALLGTSSASAATATAACAKAAAGHARCDAQVLVTRRAAQSAPSASAFGSAAPVSGDPAFIQQAYDLTGLSASKGHGDTIAIVDAFNDAAADTDLATYRAHYNLPACTTSNGCLTIDNQSGQSSPLPAANSSWATEISTDLDAVSAICPNCRIDLVEANSSSSSDLGDAMQAAAQLGANQISDSWSIVGSSSPFGSTISQLLGANAPAVIAATGDNGELTGSNNSYPAALPDVTAVGGTTLSKSNSPRGVAETAWSGAGYGCDTGESALGYQSTSSCSGRSYADISADANPSTGLAIYEAADGGWLVAGGTSVATPMVAAYEALTSVTDTTNRWAYTDSSELNAISGGSTGQTGVGSISGDIVTGAPGVATTKATGVTSTSVTLAGGVYTNGETTGYDWQYGSTNGYSAQSTTAALASANGATGVKTVITGLAPATTYHFRLTATNSAGVMYGYDFTVTTSAASAVTAPVAKAPVAKAPVAKAPVAKAPVAKVKVAKATVAKTRTAASHKHAAHAPTR